MIFCRSHLILSYCFLRHHFLLPVLRAGRFITVRRMNLSFLIHRPWFSGTLSTPLPFVNGKVCREGRRNVRFCNPGSLPPLSFILSLEGCWGWWRLLTSKSGFDLFSLSHSVLELYWCYPVLNSLVAANTTLHLNLLPTTIRSSFGMEAYAQIHVVAIVKSVLLH